MSAIEEQPCVRRRVEIAGENFYVIVGHDFVQATIPHENRPDNLQLREVVEVLCGAISDIMQMPKLAHKEQQ